MKRSIANAYGRVIKSLVALAACASLMLGAAGPALAFGNSGPSQSEGTAQMNRLQDISKRAVDAEPRNRGEVQRAAQKGPNEVQGNADLDKMNSPEDSSGATTIKDQVENALETITGNR
ncbi:MAG: hypothetical protein ACFCVD_15460 [Nodosilinea sp.]